jgi:hypothetical protein
MEGFPFTPPEASATHRCLGCLVPIYAGRLCERCLEWLALRAAVERWVCRCGRPPSGSDDGGTK